MNPVEQPPIIERAAAPPKRHPWAIFAVLGPLAAGVLVLFLFDPTQHGFFPVCPLYKTTGLLCPGCGTLRAVHQLTHGHLVAAWHFNPMFVSLLPVAAWLGFREVVLQLTGRRLPGIFTHPFLIWLIVGSLLAFGIFRNL